MPGKHRIEAATSEASLGPENDRAGVTALEIEYGLFKSTPSTAAAAWCACADCGASTRGAPLE